MTREELFNIRPGDYIWYGTKSAVNFLFFVIARGEGNELFTLTIKSPSSHVGYFFKFKNKTWKFSVYNLLTRESFLAGDEPWKE